MICLVRSVVGFQVLINLNSESFIVMNNLVKFASLTTGHFIAVGDLTV